MILSRWPIVQSRNLLYTPRLGGANHLSVQLGLLETVILTPDGLLRAYTTHCTIFRLDCACARLNS